MKNMVSKLYSKKVGIYLLVFILGLGIGLDLYKSKQMENKMLEDYSVIQIEDYSINVKTMNCSIISGFCNGRATISTILNGQEEDIFEIGRYWFKSDKKIFLSDITISDFLKNELSNIFHSEKTKGYFIETMKKIFPLRISIEKENNYLTFFVENSFVNIDSELSYKELNESVDEEVIIPDLSSNMNYVGDFKADKKTILENVKLKVIDSGIVPFLYSVYEMKTSRVLDIDEEGIEEFNYYYLGSDSKNVLSFEEFKQSLRNSLIEIEAEFDSYYVKNLANILKNILDKKASGISIKLENKTDISIEKMFFIKTLGLNHIANQEIGKNFNLKLEEIK